MIIRRVLLRVAVACAEQRYALAAVKGVRLDIINGFGNRDLLQILAVLKYAEAHAVLRTELLDALWNRQAGQTAAVGKGFFTDFGHAVRNVERFPTGASI